MNKTMNNNNWNNKIKSEKNKIKQQGQMNE